MRQRLAFLFILNLLGLGLLVMLWHILATGLVLDSHGLHLTNGQDFLNYWAAPQIAAADPSVLFTGRGYELALHKIYFEEFAQLRWSYPLHSLFFYAPFSWLPYGSAVAVWIATGLLCYLTASWHALPAEIRRPLVILLVFAPVSLIEIIARQNGFFTGAASLAVLVLLERKRPILAGILLGCLTIKPQLFILWPIMLVMYREWRCIYAAIITTLLLVAASVAVYGINAWMDYFVYLADKQWLLLSRDEFNETRKLFHLMMPGVTPALRILDISNQIVSIVQWLVSGFVICGTIMALRRPLNFSQRVLLLAVASILVSPYSFNYDMTLLTTAILLYWFNGRTLSAYDKVVTGIAYLLPLLVYILNVTDMPIAPIFLMLLFIISLRDAGIFRTTKEPS